MSGRLEWRFPEGLSYQQVSDSSLLSSPGEEYKSSSTSTAAFVAADGIKPTGFY